MYKIPVAKPDIKNDFTFIVNDSEFHADIILFACFSDLFQTDISLIEKNEYTVKSDVSKESFQDFLDGCQGKTFYITTSNVFDLYLLCKEFQINQFTDKVKEFYKQHKDEALVKKLKYFASDNKSLKNENTIKNITNKISRRLKNMNSDLKQDLFEMQLTYEIINQFLSIEDRNIEFDALIFRNIDRYGYENKEELYQHIDLRSLPMKDVQRFSQNAGKLPKFYESNRVFPFLSQLITIIEQQKEQIDELQKRVDESINGLNNEVVDIKESTTMMQNEIAGIFDDLFSIQTECHNYVKNTEEISNKYSDLYDNIEKFDQKFFPLESRFNDLEEKVMRTIIIKNPLDGIFHRLYCQKDKNPIGTKSLTINTPTAINSDFKPSNLLEYGRGKIDDCYYHNIPIKKNSNELTSKNENSEQDKNNWIEFDFGEQFVVKLVAYTIRTNTFGETFSHPKHFRIEGKNDGDGWVIIDERDDATELNGSRKIHTYFLDQVSGPFRKIRYLQLDTHFQYKDKDQIMALSAFELHGERIYIMPTLNAYDDNNNGYDDGDK